MNTTRSAKDDVVLTDGLLSLPVVYQKRWREKH